MFVQFLDRAPVSRDKDCYSLLKISEFWADAKVLVDSKVLTILSMAGRYNKLYGGDPAHKSWVQGGLASLDIYMNGNQHLIREKYETISGA